MTDKIAGRTIAEWREWATDDPPLTVEQQQLLKWIEAIEARDKRIAELEAEQELTKAIGRDLSAPFAGLPYVRQPK